MAYNMSGQTGAMEDALRGVRSLTAPSFRPAARALSTPTAPPPTAAPGVSDAIASVGKTSVTQPPQGGVAMPDPAAVAPATGAVDPATGAPASNDNLARWGYTGAIPINNVEQQAIDFTNQLYGSGGGLATMSGAQDYYQKVLAGEYGPEGQAYLQQVLDPMRTSMQTNYADMSKALANKFSQFGGYYGGRSGVAQGRLASDTVNNMAQTEANLRYQRFGDNMSQMGGAATGLQNLGTAQSSASGDMLNYLLSTGGMITGRDQMNRSEYQNAMQRSYQDWLRARSETLMPFQMGANMVGQQATQPIVTQTPSPWGAVLGAVGQMGGAALSTL